MGFFKSITKVFHRIPIVGTLIKPLAIVADKVTKPVQSVAKSTVNEVTGARKRNNRRLDAQKEQLIREAQQRVEINRQRDENNIRQIMADEVAALRAGIENVEREISNEVVETEGDVETIIPNPFFAYEECRLGTTQELTLILQMNREHEIYNFFMDLNPLQEAYLSFIDSEIGVDALLKLSTHNDEKIITARTALVSNTWINLKDAINQNNLNKAKRIISACIQMKGEDELSRLQEQQQLWTNLDDAVTQYNLNQVKRIISASIYSSRHLIFNNSDVNVGGVFHAFSSSSVNTSKNSDATPEIKENEKEIEKLTSQIDEIYLQIGMHVTPGKSKNGKQVDSSLMRELTARRVSVQEELGNRTQFRQDLQLQLLSKKMKEVVRPIPKSVFSQHGGEIQKILDDNLRLFQEDNVRLISEENELIENINNIKTELSFLITEEGKAQANSSSRVSGRHERISELELNLISKEAELAINLDERAKLAKNLLINDIANYATPSELLQKLESKHAELTAILGAPEDNVFRTVMPKLIAKNVVNTTGAVQDALIRAAKEHFGEEGKKFIAETVKEVHRKMGK
ncbi:MAG: hypothetical protein ACR2HS_01835 [Gammaproteobacteria bacterium]